LARADLLMVNFFLRAETSEEPRMEVSSSSKLLILSFISAARFNCVEVSEIKVFILGGEYRERGEERNS